MPLVSLKMIRLPSRFPLSRHFSWQDLRALLRFAGRRLDEERLPQVAGSLTFTTVLALVPMLTIAFAIFTAFPLFNTFRASLEAYFIKSLMPKAISDTVLGYLNQFASKATRLSAIGAVGLVLTTLAMMLTIDRAFNRIWRVRVQRPLIQQGLVYWAILTLGPLLIGGSITITSFVLKATGGLGSSAPMINSLLYTSVSVLLTTGAFSLLYVIVPNRPVSWRDAMWGGLLAAVAFEVAKRSFVVFITKFPAYTVIYGALAALPIFLIWIYLSWLITLLGAVVAAALPTVKHERWWHQPAPGSAFIDALVVLKALYDARVHGHAAIDLHTIRDQTRIGFDEAENLLQKMLEAGWVGCVISGASRPRSQLILKMGKRQRIESEAWALLHNPDQLRLADVYRLFVFSAAADSALAEQIEQAVEQGLQSTLAQYFSAEEMPSTA